MATGDVVNQGKGAFVEEYFTSHPDGNLESANRAWAAAGNQGSVSESLVGKVRARLGLTGRKGTNGVATLNYASPAAKGKAKTSMMGATGKARSKAEEVPSQPADLDGDTGPSKSAFVGEVLGRQPEANLKAINDAWTSAGYEGAISPSIFYKVKREVVGTGEHVLPAPVKTRPESASKGPAAQPTAETTPEPDSVPAPLQSAGGPRSGEREKVLDRVEDGIDDLIIELKRLGGMEEALEAMRKVRRVVVRSHEG